MSDRRQNRLPVIGLTSYGRIEDNKFYLPANYVDSARRAGGIPLLIPPGEEHAQVLASLLDAFVLTGGGDIDPEMYGGGSHESIYMVDNERDSTELEIAKRIVDLGRPTLGICRGTQILNVALGGTLFAHLPEEVGETVVHRVPPREPIPHPVTLQDGSRLARILQERSFSCASWHHQAIRDVAPGFDIVARAPDGGPPLAHRRPMASGDDSERRPYPTEAF
jgi:putative glutamine amidotransferase